MNNSNKKKTFGHSGHTAKRIHFVRFELPFALVTPNGEEVFVFGETIPEVVGSFLDVLRELNDFQTYKLINGLGQTVCKAQATFRPVLIAF
jgi:hypothetical protein